MVVVVSEPLESWISQGWAEVSRAPRQSEKGAKYINKGVGITIGHGFSWKGGK